MIISHITGYFNSIPRVPIRISLFPGEPPGGVCPVGTAIKIKGAPLKTLAKAAGK